MEAMEPSPSPVVSTEDAKPKVNFQIIIFFIPKPTFLVLKQNRGEFSP